MAARNMHRTRRGPIYVVRLQAGPDTDGIRALRAGLKALWRRYRLRCIDAREVRPRQTRTKGGTREPGKSKGNGERCCKEGSPYNPRFLQALNPQ